MKSLQLFLKIIFSALLIAISPVIMAQQVVTGRITDADDGTPVHDAAIFIANTTIGTTSNASGNYSITVQGTGSFEIVVSHVAYQPVFRKIETPQSSHQYDVALKVIEIEDIIIKAPKTYGKKDIDLFWRELLGVKPSKNGLEVLNPEKVNYYLNNDNVLKAMCREPIEIVNHQMGYRIRYILENFQHDYRSKETTLQGKPFFEEMTPLNSRQKERWEKKRVEVYAISFNHFLRTLYREQIHEEGFLILNRELLTNGRIHSVGSKDILQTGHAAQVSIKAPLLLICYAKPVTGKMIESAYSEIVESGKKYPMVDLQPQQVRIYPDGSYSGQLKIKEHPISIFGLASVLPVEYTETKQQTTHNLTVLPSSALPAIEENMAAQLKVYPQEKIHLHTDRDVYIPGEKIWLKAYLVDALSHIHTSAQTQSLSDQNHPVYSHYVYVELVSSADSLVNRVML